MFLTGREESRLVEGSSHSRQMGCFFLYWCDSCDSAPFPGPPCPHGRGSPRPSLVSVCPWIRPFWPGSGSYAIDKAVSVSQTRGSVTPTVRYSWVLASSSRSSSKSLHTYFLQSILAWPVTLSHFDWQFLFYVWESTSSLGACVTRSCFFLKKKTQRKQLNKTCFVLIHSTAKYP